MVLNDVAQSVAGDEVLMIKSRQVHDHTEACRYASLSDNMGAPEALGSRLHKFRAFHSWGYKIDIKLILQSRCLRRVLNLRGSPIIKLPQSVGKLKHLRYLDISSSLVTILPNSISNLHNLHTLHLYNCSNLRIVPMSICSLRNLETLNLSACNFSNLPDSIGNLERLHNLNISFCNFLDTLPSSIGKLQRLQVLNLKGCVNLRSLPDTICSLRNLKFFNLAQCGFLQALPENLGNLSNLSYLNLSQCNVLKSIPDTIGHMTRLHTLNMSHCSSLSEVPESIDGLQELQVLILSHHLSSLALPISIGCLQNIQILDLSWNIDLKELPKSIGNLRRLKILILFQCWSLHSLPDSLLNLVMLESLNLIGCEQLSKLPDGIISNSNLKHLRNDHCRTLARLPRGFGRWTKLETLSLLIVGDDKYSSIAELEDLNLLTGELRIEFWSNKNDLMTDAERANLRHKRKLSSLSLSWTGSCSCDDPTGAETLLEVLVPPENLEILEIGGYMGTKLPSWMMNSMELWLPNLVSLSLSNIHNCTCLPLLGCFPYLQSLQFRHMSSVHSMGSEILVAKHCSIQYQSLKELHFEDMPNLEIWPTSSVMDHKYNQLELSMFPVLKTVTVTECPWLKPSPCLPDAVADLLLSSSSEILTVGRIFGPSSSSSASLLRRLWIKNCHATSSDWKLLWHGPKLENLVIESCGTIHVLPEAIRSLTGLRSLRILNCAELEAIPEWIGELVTLESLEISCCPKLVSMPSELQSLIALEELIIVGCSSVLTERCRKDAGQDWFKIRHIPSVLIS